MARTTSVTIGSQLEAFIQQQIAQGRYGSTSEVVRSALRLLEHQEQQLAALKAAVASGTQSGVSAQSLDTIAAEIKAQYHV